MVFSLIFTDELINFGDLASRKIHQPFEIFHNTRFLFIRGFGVNHTGCHMNEPIFEGGIECIAAGLFADYSAKTAIK